MITIVSEGRPLDMADRTLEPILENQDLIADILVLRPDSPSQRTQRPDINRKRPLIQAELIRTEVTNSPEVSLPLRILSVIKKTQRHSSS